MTRNDSTFSLAARIAANLFVSAIELAKPAARFAATIGDRALNAWPSPDQCQTCGSWGYCYLPDRCPKDDDGLAKAEEDTEVWEPDDLWSAMQRHPAGKHRREDADRTSGEYETRSDAWDELDVDEPIPCVPAWTLDDFAAAYKHLWANRAPDVTCVCTPPDDDYENPIGEVPCVTREDLSCCSKVSAAGVRHQLADAPGCVSASNPGHSSSPAGVDIPPADTSRRSTSVDDLAAEICDAVMDAYDHAPTVCGMHLSLPFPEEFHAGFNFEDAARTLLSYFDISRKP